MRWCYVPPLMVYFAAGVSGFTAIIASFFVKEQLGLSAAFLAGIGFWAGLPWALKMPIGHLVDIFWRWESAFVYLGAVLMAASLLLMVGLTGHTQEMTAMLPAPPGSSTQAWPETAGRSTTRPLKQNFVTDRSKKVQSPLRITSCLRLPF